MGKGTDNTGIHTQTEQKRDYEHVFWTALLCRLRGKVKPCHCQRIRPFPLFAVQTDEPHAELHAALNPRGRIKPVGFETASAFPVLFTAV